MMRTKTFIAVSLMLSVFSVQDAQAQFFKKLGKVAGAVINAAAGSAKTSSNSSASNGGAKGYIPNVDFQVKSCEYWGDDVLVRFVVTNTSSSDLLFRPYFGDMDAASAQDDADNIHAIEFNVGGDEGWGYEVFKTLPAGVPVKGYITIKDVHTSCRSIKSVHFSGIVAPDDKSGGTQFSYTIGANAIEMPNNTNADNIFVSLPILQFNMNKIYRDKTGKNVIIDATVKNLGSRELKLSDSDGSGHAVYDSEGNPYKHTMTIGGVNLSSWDGVVLPPETPMKAQITIPNVPANIHEFSIIKHKTTCGNQYYYIQIKNQKID